MIILIILAVLIIIPTTRRIVFSYIPKLPKFTYVKAIDLYRYIKHKEWKQFKGFGVHIYVGLFGKGKTISMVKKAYDIAAAYPDVQILTNIKLKNFPAHTVIKPLVNYKDIIEAPGNTLILLDEISSILNSRRWDKEGVPPALLGQIMQIRKQRKMILATAQRFMHVDKLVRDITHTVRDCNTMLGRWTFVTYYDAYEYENQNAMKPAIPIAFDDYIQTDALRESYDTYELIDSMKKEDFLTDREILDKQGVSNGDVIVSIDPKKKQRRKLI